jgi:alpha-mannosidase
VRTPALHLICNAHLDPVWQWRWEEGCGEALSTFGEAVRILREHKRLVFCHNEAILYEWVRVYEPPLFREIQKLAKAGRWHIGGGWFLQPDVNLPGTESIIRQIAYGRRFFAEHFAARPVVAYNFDSFGHSGGLPQILRQAGYAMYIHMRPQDPDLRLPGDLYRWRGVDGSEILVYRIAVGLYHTERDNMTARLQEGTELALKLGRDVPVFWGIGNHGGGATREDLERIDEFSAKERRVLVRHSTPEKFLQAVRRHGANAPVVEGDLQRVFTGCYTSLARVKRRAQSGLGELVQTEALCSGAWWTGRGAFPRRELTEAWKDHLFNDFHDILPGSCTEPAESDALDQYGRASVSARRLRLGAAAAFNRGRPSRFYVPVSVFNTNTSCRRVPVEVECMLDLRPKWSGTWHLSMRGLDGRGIECQEEQPESLLPFNGWRRKVVFFGDLPAIGVGRYEIQIQEGSRPPAEAISRLRHEVDEKSGLLRSLRTPSGQECLRGPLMEPIIVEDRGDAWGSECWSYREIVGRCEPVPGTHRVLHAGSVRTVRETQLAWGGTRAVVRTIMYPDWPVVEYRIRVVWNESHRRLKLVIPTALEGAQLFVEVPGGAIGRPCDGQEHVHGRWCVLHGTADGTPAAVGIAHTGLHGLDCLDGELRLSVLRGAAYCHERGLRIDDGPYRKRMDQGVHEISLAVMPGDPDNVRATITGLADWLSAPPAVYTHLPIGAGETPREQARFAREELLHIVPDNVRLTACIPAADGKGLVIRLQETAGVATAATISAVQPRVRKRMSLAPFEIRTLRIGKNGTVAAAPLLTDLEKMR